MIDSVKSQNFSNFILQNTQNNTNCDEFQKKPTLDKMIQDTYELNNPESKKPSFFNKLFQHPSLTCIPMLPLFVGELYSIGKLLFLRSKAKKSQIPMERVREYLGKLPKRLLVLGAAAVPLYFAVDFLNKKLKAEHLNNANKIIDDFNSKNKTNVKLVNKPISSLHIAALADSASARVILGDNFNEDLIYSNIYQKPILKHELVHMKQYMLIGCSKDGIKKLNFLNVKSFAASLDENGRKEVYNAYQEINSGINDYYKNATIDRFGHKFSMVDYITALYKVIYEKDTTENDVPIIINKDFYESYAKTRGKLSEEEEKRAQEYFKALSEYPKDLGIKILMPNSDYRKNILEVEANKDTPWYLI